MKILLVLLTAIFLIAILLIAGFQFIRLFVNELSEMIAEAWRSPELPSSQ
jgi:cell division protein FtsL